MLRSPPVSTLAIAALLALPLAACDRADQGTSLSINAADGSAGGAIDGRTGEMKVNLPGFSGQIKLPKLQLDAGDFDLNGVHLYPGSRIESMDIGGGHNRDGAVRIRFSSPAAPGVVQRWFEERLAKAGFTITRDGQGLAGRTDEDKPFRMTLGAQGPQGAQGTITLGE